jgi:hypothetical protein
MSEFPKSFVWENGEVITFLNEHDVRKCRENCTWTYQNVISSRVWKPLEIQSDTELTLLRTFRDTVLNAAQVTPNHQLPAAIFHADDVVRRGMRTEVTT